MPLTFVVGAATDVFEPEFARSVDAALRRQYPAFTDDAGVEAYRSEEVDGAGWLQLQKRAVALLGTGMSPNLTSIEAYQAVYLPMECERVEHLPVPPAADPLHVGCLPLLIQELRALAAAASLPTDDVELMHLAVRYMEDDELFDRDLDVQTFVQLMLTAGQAAARRQPMWIVA